MHRTRNGLYLELEMGEVVLLHNWTLHRSEVNTTNRPRRGFSVCYIDAATRQVSTGRVDIRRSFQSMCRSRNRKICESRPYIPVGKDDCWLSPKGVFYSDR